MPDEMFDYKRIDVKLIPSTEPLVEFTDYHLECALHWLEGVLGIATLDDIEFLFRTRLRWELRTMLYNSDKVPFPC